MLPLGENGKNALLATALIGLLPILVLQPLPHLMHMQDAATRKSSLHLLVSFASGGLLGDSFLHLIPHAMESHDHGDHDHQHHHHHDHHHEPEHKPRDHSAEGHCHEKNGAGTCELGHDSEPTHSSGAHGHHNHDDHSHDVTKTMYLVLFGVLLFFVIQRLAQIFSEQNGYHAHSHSHSHSHSKAKENGSKDSPSSGMEGSSILNIIADSAHNFTDGLALAASFSSSTKLGISTTIAIFFHEIPHEIGDYGILLQKGFSHWQATQVQFLTALASLCGALFGIFMDGYDVESKISDWALPITAGGFIYIALVDVLADLLREKTSLLEFVLQVTCISLGILMMALVDLLEHL
eukprot:CAMPEP_0114517678 /NCGR_PEP_ID=MMETSP0109-20121206/18027_1 /TAXON_ID=29199 /ORGANISM="Chlorarachnion reptans, Strain CCCM449" /LENGTH=349 /DNA_ID=CAMNT_0001698225 /DNA_START=55 /DNA_END=1104 /DNA_ORIENTATION=-